MTRHFLLAIAVLLLGGSTAAQPRGSAELSAAVDAWVAAWNSYDLNAVDTLFVTDANVTYYSSEKAGLIRGIDSVREHHRGFGFVAGGKMPDAKLWLDDVASDTYGDVALVRATWFFERAAPGAPVQRGPMTAVYVRRAGHWRIAHMHFANDPPAKQL